MEDPATAAREPLDTVVVIETPEHVRFRHTLAGPVRRGLAYALDTLCRGVVLGLMIGIATLGHFSLHDETNGIGYAGGVLWVVAFAVEWAYFVLFETLWNGRSPGKRALGLRVISASGRPLGFVDSVLRNLLRAADFLPVAYVIGFVTTALDGRFRRLGDMVGGTLVVADQRGKVDAPLQGLARPTAAELGAVPAELALLADEIEAAELFLRRRSSLPANRAEELAEIAVKALSRGARAPALRASRVLEVLYFNAIAGGVRAAPRSRARAGGRRAVA